jgi:hypothetical protein
MQPPFDPFINRTDTVRTSGGDHPVFDAVCNIISAKNRLATVSFMTTQGIIFKIAGRSRNRQNVLFVT